jgi:Ca2+-binding RTX toxin-like protein
LLEETNGDPLASSEANALLDNLHIFLDDGSGSFEAANDTLVTTVSTFSLTAGVQTVNFADGDPLVQIAYGQPRTYFVVIDVRSTGTIRITHRTESGSTAEDAVYDIPLRMEFAADVSSSVVQIGAVDRVFNGTAGADQFIVRPKTGDPTRFEVEHVGVETSELTYADVLSLTVNGLGGNDSLDATAFDRPVTLVGGNGDDTLLGGASDDWLAGGAGPDFLNSAGGADTLLGGSDDDVLFAGAGKDLLDGGDGNDRLHGQGSRDTLTGGNGDDVLRGGSALDRLVETADVDLLLTDGALMGLGTDILEGIDAAELTGGDGDNRLDAATFSWPVTLKGGRGNDTLIGGRGADVLVGNADDDWLNGQEGRDTIQGRSGADKLFGGSGRDLLDGGPGDDVLHGHGADDSLRGADGNDSLFGGAGTDTVVEWADADFTLTDGHLTGRGSDVLAGIEQGELTGGDSDNSLDARQFTLGNVTLNGGLGADSLIGGPGDDFLNGGGGDDRLNGKHGDDWIDGGEGNDGLSGGDGNDHLNGRSGYDTLLGGNGNDSLLGGAGQDIVLGEAGIDRVKGHGEDDTIAGGGNGIAADVNDTVVGGETVDDNFVFDAPWVNV